MMTARVSGARVDWDCSVQIQNISYKWIPVALESCLVVSKTNGTLQGHTSNCALIGYPGDLVWESGNPLVSSTL